MIAAEKSEFTTIKPANILTGANPFISGLHQIFNQLTKINLPNDFGKKMELIMGGAGSGTWYRYEAKRTIGQMFRLDIRNMKKRGMLDSGKHTIRWFSSRDGEATGRASIYVLSGKGMVVGCMWESDRTGKREELRVVVKFVQSACAFGSFRQWFLCPGCRSRVGILVLHPPIVACRNCLDLSYESQNEHAMYRALRRRDKIGARLGVSDHFDFYSATKPKWMHWVTFHRLRREYEEADELSEISFLGRFY